MSPSLAPSLPPPCFRKAACNATTSAAECAVRVIPRAAIVRKTSGSA